MKKLLLENLTFITIAIISLLLFNAVLYNFNFYADVTEEKLFTLSDKSKEIVQKLDDNIIIKAFFTKDMPPQISETPRVLKDFLKELRTASEGKIVIEFIDPDESETNKSIADEFFIQPVPVNIIEDDRMSVRKIYSGLVFLYEDKKEIVPFVTFENLTTIEYDIMNVISKLIKDKKPNLGVVTDYNTAPLNNLKNGLTALSQHYNLSTVELSKIDQIPDSLDLLFIISPDSLDYTPIEKIDKFISKGGKVGLFIDMVSTDIMSNSAKEKDIYINMLLEKYGIKLNYDLVGTEKCSSITVTQVNQDGKGVNYNVLYPFLPIVTNYNQNIAAVQNLREAVLYFPGSIEILNKNNNLKKDILFSTSDNSFAHQSPFDINPLRKIEEYKFNKKNIPLAVSLEGKFPDLNGKISDTNSRVLVVADGEFFQDNMMRTPTNMDLFLNLVDYLAVEDNLLDIRSKDYKPRPLKSVSKSNKLLIKLANIFLIPFIFILIGIIRWRANNLNPKRK